MNKTKKWILIWFLTISSLIFIGVFNYIMDPYQQYRKASFYKVPFENERELNSGLAKNFDYDSVVIGTSMMENFNIDDLHNILHFDKPIKLTMAGSSAYEQKIILNTALRHQKVKNVLWGIDFLSFYGKADRLKHGEAFFPNYLYDENILNDYKYLLSSDTLGRVFEIFLKNKEDDWLYDYSKMYEWKSKTKDKNILSAVKNRWDHRELFDNEASKDEKKLDCLKKNFETNVYPMIKNNKDVQFILIFPPYSILADKTYQERGQLQEFINFKFYIIKLLSTYKNVKIYDFQISKQITYNLLNYYDLYHYNKIISHLILEEIQTDKYNTKRIDYVNESQKFLNDVYLYDVKTAF